MSTNGDIPRRKFIGKRVDLRLATDESEHFMTCGGCGGKIDCRDLGSVFDHEGLLPHPAQDQPQ